MLDTFKHKGKRKRMVEDLANRGITDERVLNAMAEVPRHLFIEAAFEADAYKDKALPIARGQTISQPFTVAYQSQLLGIKPRLKVLEIGTGSGYQAAILSCMGARVFSVELDRRLHNDAHQLLEELQYHCTLFHGDGSVGWTKFQPYDRILITAASPSVPEPLKRQLKIGGILVAPVGDRNRQHMLVMKRLAKDEFVMETLDAFRFVPLRGKHGFEE